MSEETGWTEETRSRREAQAEVSHWRAEAGRFMRLYNAEQAGVARLHAQLNEERACHDCAEYRGLLAGKLAQTLAEVERLRAEVTEAHTALAEAARRFVKKDDEGVRQILCDINARGNVRSVIEQAEALRVEVERLRTALREIEQATEGIPEANCALANRIARLALRGDTAPAEEKRGYAPTDAIGDARAEAAEPRCVRCGSRYSPGGACSRRAEGCQGGRGEWTTFFPPAEEPKP